MVQKDNKELLKETLTKLGIAFTNVDELEEKSKQVGKKRQEVE
jgi:hypothetical protein